VGAGRLLTAEDSVRREALGLVRRLCDQPLPLPELLSRVREDPTLRDPVRQQALELIEPYRRGLLRRDADCLIRSLALQAYPRQDLVAAIPPPPGLPEAPPPGAPAPARPLPPAPA